MTAWMLNYLFYVGIVLPTVVTLALFVFFVICWRRQSARKVVLTKPYDPHGTMRRLGISSRPPPPPVFNHSILPSPEDVGGEDNAAYDMSRSPSAETNAGGNTTAECPVQFHANFSGDMEMTGQQQVHRLQGSPCGEMDMMDRLAFHNRLDSGLSEPACESPVGGTSGGAEGAGGGGRERPQSQASHASHSSHSTDSEDSGFRSSRSGQLAQSGQGCTHEPSVMKRSRSAGRNHGRGHYHKTATSSPDSEGDPPIQLTPTALWPHHPHIHTHHHHSHLVAPHHPLPGQGETTVKTTEVGLNDIRGQLGWKYLQDLAFPGPQPMSRSAPGSSPTHRHILTCQQSMTLAQVHPPRDRDNPDVFGFSVV